MYVCMDAQALTFQPNAILNKIEQIREKFNDLSADCSGLKTEVSQLLQVKEEIKELKENINGQNKVIVDLLSDVKVLIQTSIGPGQNSSKYSDLFPIHNHAELYDIENEKSEATKDAMIATLSKIVRHGGLQKNLPEIFHKSLLLQFNIDGKQGKKRLLDHPKLLNAIYNMMDSEEFISKKDFFPNSENL